MSASHSCSTDGCDNQSTMKCPTCIKMNMPDSWFCTQDCFKSFWKTHNRLHKEQKQLIKKIRAFQPPHFDYTGPLRPHFISPMRDVPSTIKKPDYYLDGNPTSEVARKRETKIEVKTKAQIRAMRKVCKLARKCLDLAGRAVAVGVTTEEIDKVVHQFCLDNKCYPSPLNYHYFPKSCCTSVNEVICHGIPDARPLEDGDIVNIDITLYVDGYHGDLNETYLVGDVSQEYKDLIKVTYDSMMNSINHVRPGVMCREFGKIIQKHVGKSGYSVVRSYCGHGIGQLFHTAPNIPHYSKNKAVGVLKPGMTFTIEPMINMGVWKDVTWPDDWTAVTKDGKRSAQFEHTVLVTEAGVEILTARTENSVPFWWEEEEKQANQKQ